MRRRTCIAIALAVAACSDRTTALPEVAPVSPPAKPPPAASDIVIAPDKTSEGGLVIELGKPRFQVTPEMGVGFEVRFASDRAFVADRDEVKVFEIAHGTVIARWNPTSVFCDDAVGAIYVSANARWLAACNELIATPFTGPRSARDVGDFAGFSSDSKLALTAHESVTLADLAQNKPVATLPAPPAYDQTLGITHDGTRVIWIRSREVLVAAPGAATWKVLLTSPVPWKYVFMAAGGRAALATTKSSIEHLDFVSGKTTKVNAPASPLAAISPNGTLIAFSGQGTLQVVRATGETVATIPNAEHVRRIGFGDENVLAYLDDQTIRLYDLRTGPRVIEEPARFRGWASDSTAIVAHGPKLEQLALPALTTTPATPAPSTPMPAGAPAWATQVSTGPGGVVIASDLVVTDAPIWRRSDTNCAAKLRIWTATGGERTFALVPTEDNDPCWSIAGGRVLAATTRSIAVYDAVKGTKIAALDVGDPPEPGPDLAYQYWMATVSPTGTHLALWWRRADVWPPSTDPNEESPSDRQCSRTRNYECVSEYFAEMWTLGAKPQRVWKRRFDAKHNVTSSIRPEAKIASSSIVFTHDGKHVLFGFDDGDIGIMPVGRGALTRFESLHRVPVTRIELSPNDTYVFSEDSEGVQRLWPLGPLDNQ